MHSAKLAFNVNLLFRNVYDQYPYTSSLNAIYQCQVRGWIRIHLTFWRAGENLCIKIEVLFLLAWYTCEHTIHWQYHYLNKIKTELQRNESLAELRKLKEAWNMAWKILISDTLS